MYISSIKNKMTILVVMLSLIVGMCVGSGTSTAKETVGIDKKIADNAKGSLSKKKAKTVSKSNYTYCNDDNLYLQNGKYLEQYTLDGRMVKKWKLKSGKWKLSYVNNKEILYIQKKNKKEQLWSIPIVKTKTGDKLKLKKAEKVLTPEKGFDGFSYVYADENYIAYTYFGKSKLSGYAEAKYTEYDRKAQKHIAIDSHSNNIYVELDKWTPSCTWMNYAGTAGVLLGRYYYDALDEIETAEGIYYHKLGSGKVTKIGENYNSDDPAGGLRIASYGKKIFYTGVCRTKRDMKNERQSDDIYVYDATKKKACIFISAKRWNKFLQKRDGVKKHYLSDCRVDEGRLYLFVERNRYDEIFSCSVKSASELVYEKKLNKFLKNKYGVFDVIKGRFWCSEGGNDEGVETDDFIYDKKTGKGRVYKKNDREWYYWMYNNTD